MSRSFLLDGILAEDADAARAHVWTFDHATVFGEICRRFLPGAGSAPKNPVRHAWRDGLIRPIESNDWQAAKLSRILRHLDLRFDASPSEAELVDLCLQAEARAVALLKRVQGRGNPKKRIKPFHGDFRGGPVALCLAPNVRAA